jgi:hypothetical protein
MQEKPADDGIAPASDAVAEAAQTCANGGVPILGVCPDVAPAVAEALSDRMTGHWNWQGTTCAAGPDVTKEDGRLVFTTADTRFVHAIERETSQSVMTRVLEPSFALGEQYVLTPEYAATSEPRNFNLVVENKTAGTRDTWEPCEP